MKLLHKLSLVGAMSVMLAGTAFANTYQMDRSSYLKQCASTGSPEVICTCMADAIESTTGFDGTKAATNASAAQEMAKKTQECAMKAQ